MENLDEPVTNDELVQKISDMRRDKTSKSYDLFINELLKAKFLCPVKYPEDKMVREVDNI